MSKLQVLAASRRKKIDEKKQDGGVAEARTHVSRLSISDSPLKENTKPGSRIALGRQKPLSSPVAAEAVVPPGRPLPGATYPIGTGDAADDMEVDHTTPGLDLASADDRDANHGDAPREACVISTRNTPSAFARTLFASQSSTAISSHSQNFSLPYTMSPAFDANAFAKPSPDDVVLAAQAQGSRFAKPK